ncbi:MAG: heavy metal translocating P-type ATPase [Deltaproteobacteria bacterium]|nr:heavy metal translocating P-type ATPase [Deltaproteobacteria bacterium]
MTRPSTDFLELQLPIEGMTCAGCATRLTKVLNRQDVVAEADVSFGTESARVFLECAKSVEKRATALVAIERSVAKAGFALRTEDRTLEIHGMTCSTCSERVEKALLGIPGVKAASVNAASERAFITFFAGAVSLDVLLRAVEKAGYSAAPAVLKEEAKAAENERQRRQSLLQNTRLGISLLCTLPLIAPMLAMPFGIHWMPPSVVQLVLAGAVQVVAGAAFYRGAYASLRGGVGNMDVLVSLGTSAAFVLSVVQMARGNGELYFEASASVLSFLLIGKRLELRAKKQTRSAVDALGSLRPERCSLVDDEGRLSEVALDAVRVGQRVQVAAHSPIPVDGKVVKGNSQVDLSHLTGEIKWLNVKLGDDVLAGAMNQEGVLIVECTVMGSEGTIARMVQLLEQAQGERAPIEKLVDRVSVVFVPVVIAIAASVFVGHFLAGFSVEVAILRSVAVLVVACPCALGLATPTALVAGLGVAARRGVLVSGASTFEMLAQVGTVVFDKTGTLTEGRPALRAAWRPGLDPCDDENGVLLASGNDDSSPAPFADELSKVAALERGVPHPLALAFASYDRGEIRVDDVKNSIGFGLSGSLSFSCDENEHSEKKVFVGSLAFVERTIEGFTAPPCSAIWQEKGWTVLFLFDVLEVKAAFAIGDDARSDAEYCVQELQKRNLHLHVLSGDTRGTAEAFARSLQINNIKAEMSPADKLDVIGALCEENASKGERVLFIGDGVNDGPALAKADVGMTLSSGTDVALLAADVVALRDDLTLLLTSLNLGRAVQRKIRQNLFWAFCYNVVALPLAAFGFLSPVLAGAAMALSSTSVVLNALLLYRFPKQKRDA